MIWGEFWEIGLSQDVPLVLLFPLWECSESQALGMTFKGTAG